MTVYYLDLKNGNDSNDGTSFANRKKTVQSFGSTPTGGDEIRVVGQPSTLVDATAKINNCNGDTYTSRSISFTYSTTLGETSCYYSNHGMQTGDLIRIWNNSDFSTHDERPNGVWTITRVDVNNFKLNEYTAPSGTSSGGGYMRYMKGAQVTLTNDVVKNVACYGQTGNWTASTDVTATLETSTGYWSTNTRIKSRNYSNKIAIADGFGTGKAAYFATGTLDLSGYQQIAFHVGQDSGTRSAPLNPNVSLRLCTDTQGDTSVHTIPFYTGEDSQTSRGFWRAMRKDFEANLNSSIQSIALYVDTDNGAQNFYFDNIIACKASSANDSITLSSIVGLKTSTEWPNYYQIYSIYNGNIIKLDGAGMGAYDNRHPVGYYTSEHVFWPTDPGIGITFYIGGTQTVPIYKIEPLRIVEDMGIETPNGTNYLNETYFSSSQAGISTTNRITISGGWDASNSMTSQYDGGYSAVDCINGQGRGWFMQNCNYADFSNFLGIRGYYAMYVSGCDYCSFDHLAGIGGYYAFRLEYSDYYRDVYIWSSHGRSRSMHIQYQDSGNTDGTIDYNVGYARTSFSFGGSYALQMEYLRNGTNRWDRIEAYGGYNQAIYFSYNNQCNLEYVRTGRWPQGGASPTAFYSYQNYGPVTIGILSTVDCYYGLRNSQRELNVNNFFETVNPYSRADGGNGYSNTQYSIYTENSGPIKVVTGGITSSRYYAGQSPLYLNNVVDNYTSSHSVNSGQAIYAKNYDGVSGQVLNQYQYGTVEKETSIRHTASGVSWKIDISSSSATSGSPIEWLLTKLVVNANAAVTCKIWVYRDGTGVNGGLRVKAGSIAGVTQNYDGVITDTTVNSWVECSLTFTPTEAGAVDIYAMGYYVSNNSHNVYLDDFSASQA